MFPFLFVLQPITTLTSPSFWTQWGISALDGLVHQDRFYAISQFETQVKKSFCNSGQLWLSRIMAMAVEVPLPKRECPLLPPYHPSAPSSSSKSQSSPYTMPVTHGSFWGLVRDIILVFNQSTPTSWKCKTTHKIAPNTLQSENELRLCWQTERDVLPYIPSHPLHNGQSLTRYLASGGRSGRWWQNKHEY